MKYNEHGEEIPDPTPIRTTPKIRITPNKLAEFQAMLRTASYLAKNEGFETLEESEDFDVEDYDPTSPWELQFDPYAGKEITRQEAQFLERQRTEFTKKFGKETPWYKKVFQKGKKAASEPVKPNPKSPPVDPQPEDPKK